MLRVYSLIFKFRSNGFARVGYMRCHPTGKVKAMSTPNGTNKKLLDALSGGESANALQKKWWIIAAWETVHVEALGQGLTSPILTSIKEAVAACMYIQGKLGDPPAHSKLTQARFLRH